MRKLLPFTPLVLLGLVPVAEAADLDLKIEIPTLAVAEYHKPYVAAWIEREDGSVVATVALWYEVRSRNNEGEKYLKDLRQWWRRAGRDLKVPVDGLTGATRAPGEQQLTLADGRQPMPKLEPGKYRLMVEAAREGGGRESLALPFAWPAAAGAVASAKGKEELGTVSLNVR
jgi:hypothetical protein